MATPTWLPMSLMLLWKRGSNETLGYKHDNQMLDSSLWTPNGPEIATQAGSTSKTHSLSCRLARWWLWATSPMARWWRWWQETTRTTRPSSATPRPPSRTGWPDSTTCASSAAAEEVTARKHEDNESTNTSFSQVLHKHTTKHGWIRGSTRERTQRSTNFLLTGRSTSTLLCRPRSPPGSILNGHTGPVILNQSQANVPTYLFKTPDLCTQARLHSHMQGWGGKEKFKSPSTQLNGNSCQYFTDSTALPLKDERIKVSRAV